MYTIYQVTNIQTNHYYIGVHKTTNPMDSYMGSGIHITRAIQKYGRANFKKEILEIHDSREIAYQREREILESKVLDAMCYNMKAGGIGGFEYIHSHPECNCMKSPIVARRNKMNRLARIQLDPEFHKKLKATAIQNLQRAVESNTGKKRPEHGKLIGEQSRQRWLQNKEHLRNCLSSTFEVIDPSGKRFVTNRLEEFCQSHGLAYTSLWETSRGKSPTIRGKSAGWTCKRIS